MTLASVVTDKRTIRFFATLENKLNMLHASKYDYSDTIYQTKRLNFSYKCPVHGVITQNAGEHIRGRGCIACSVVENSKTLFNRAKEKLIDSCIYTHGNTYNYSKVEYKGADVKILIICKIAKIRKFPPLINNVPHYLDVDYLFELSTIPYQYIVGLVS